MQCDLSSSLPSPAVTALTMQRQSTFGCYHPEAAGLLPNDVHVIDLRVRGGSGRVRRSAGAAGEVVVDLVPGQADTTSPLPRNLTLILKSDGPVRWLLKSHGIKGQLIVAAGQDNRVIIQDFSNIGQHFQGRMPWKTCRWDRASSLTFSRRRFRTSLRD